MSIEVAKPGMWCPGLAAGQLLADGLVGLWPFWEGGGAQIMDVSGAGNRGALVNMDPATDWRGAELGLALDFDGTDDRIDLGTAIGLQQYSGSVAVWFTSGTTGVGRYIFAHRAGGNQRIYLLVANTTFLVGFANSFNAIDSGVVVENDGLWHCGVVTWNATDAFAYLDGESIGTFNGTLSSAPVGTCRFGSDAEGAPGSFFQGSIAYGIASTRQWTAGEVRGLCKDRWGLITHQPQTDVLAIAASGMPTEWYYLYRGVGGIANVDFSTPVGTVGGGNATKTFEELVHAANTRYTYVLRPVRTLSGGGLLITPDMSCTVEFETDGDTEWLGERPGMIEGISAEIISGGEIRLRWSFRTPYGGSAPNDFGIYYSTDPDIVPGSPDTTETYTNDGQYVKDITLADGTAYWFAITSRTSAPVESFLSEIIGPFIADDTAPDAPDLTVSATF